jgi:hypothetical protein
VESGGWRWRRRGLETGVDGEGVVDIGDKVVVLGYEE